MKFQAVKGMRDFYPEDMAVLNWILAGWRGVSVRHGFQEFDSPLLEYLDLYTVKSGEGIVSELFHLTDRGGRDLAIRPEVTPTLARMVAARANALPRPIKWFTMPRLCRAGKAPAGPWPGVFPVEHRHHRQRGCGRRRRVYFCGRRLPAPGRPDRQ